MLQCGCLQFSTALHGGMQEAVSVARHQTQTLPACLPACLPDKSGGKAVTADKIDSSGTGLLVTS